MIGDNADPAAAQEEFDGSLAPVVWLPDGSAVVTSAPDHSVRFLDPKSGA